jgi:hypothetical protein
VEVTVTTHAHQVVQVVDASAQEEHVYAKVKKLI